jgi:hypothetical protein
LPYLLTQVSFDGAAIATHNVDDGRSASPPTPHSIGICSTGIDNGRALIGLERAIRRMAAVPVMLHVRTSTRMSKGRALDLTSCPQIHPHSHSDQPCIGDK